MGKRADGVARVRAGEAARGDGLGSDAAWQRVGALLRVRLVRREVGIVDIVAREGQRLLRRARVAWEETRRHGAPREDVVRMDRKASKASREGASFGGVVEHKYG